jgi:hypothetical protein
MQQLAIPLSQQAGKLASGWLSRKRPTSVDNVSKVRMIVILPCPVNLNQTIRIVCNRFARIAKQGMPAIYPIPLKVETGSGYRMNRSLTRKG